MKVHELIEMLQNCFDQDAEVHFAYNYGDHSRTTVCPAVDAVEEGAIKHSDYHNMPKLIDEDDYEEKYEDEAAAKADGVTHVVVLMSC